MSMVGSDNSSFLRTYRSLIRALPVTKTLGSRVSTMLA